MGQQQGNVLGRQAGGCEGRVGSGVGVGSNRAVGRDNSRAGEGKVAGRGQ